MPGYLGPPYEHDVFVSYAHGFAAGGASPLKVWTNRFADLLWADVANADPALSDLSIWDDRRLDRTAPLTEELKRKVAQAGLLLIVMSPAYLKSAWCEDEREWFRGELERRSAGNGRDGQVFVVRAISTRGDEWPDFLKDSRGHTDLGFCFHPETRDPGVSPFGWPKPNEDDRAFYRALEELRTPLIRRLRELKGRLAEAARQQAAAAAPGAAGRPRLFLHTPPDAPPAVRTDVEGGLRAGGCDVIAAPPPRPGTSIADGKEDSDARIKVAAHCDALTLLRAPGHERFEDDLITIAFQERDRIASRRGRRMPCAILDADGSEAWVIETARGTGIAHFDTRAPGWPAQVAAWAREGAAA